MRPHDRWINPQNSLSSFQLLGRNYTVFSFSGFPLAATSLIACSLSFDFSTVETPVWRSRSRVATLLLSALPPTNLEELIFCSLLSLVGWSVLHVILSILILRGSLLQLLLKNAKFLPFSAKLRYSVFRCVLPPVAIRNWLREATPTYRCPTTGLPEIGAPGKCEDPKRRERRWDYSIGIEVRAQKHLSAFLKLAKLKQVIFLLTRSLFYFSQISPYLGWKCIHFPWGGRISKCDRCRDGARRSAQ